MLKKHYLKYARLGKGEIMGRFLRKIKNKQYGQAMAEFALTIPIFLLLVFGVIELSRFFLVYSSVYTASREATRYGSSVGEGGPQNYMNCNAIAERAVFSGSFGGVQMEDVKIFYESSPGNIVASCPDTNSGSNPVIGNCHDGSINCEDEDNPPSTFFPELGDRIIVDIETDFSSLLGIVPDLPIRTSNGRTIMMEISVPRTAAPFDLCSESVSLLNTEPLADGETILYFDLENVSEEASFIIYQIRNIAWDVSADEPKLKEIRWSSEENPIWISNPVEGNLPNLTIPDAGSIDYWKEFTRNLATENTERLEFVFDENEGLNLENINFTVDIIMQHSSLPTDFCDPVE
jgi:Flp pilus assembly protein TadG